MSTESQNSPPPLVSIDGAIGAIADATISISDDGLLRGDGVFEVAKLYRGVPYALDEHLDRIEHSAAAITLPIDRDSLQGEITALIETAEFEGEATLRLVCTRGGRRIAMLEPLPQWPETTTLATITYAPSVILTGVKSISYAANMQATRAAQQRGAAEALLVREDGLILEAPTSSIFWVGADGVMRTPALDCGLLDSITRRRILEATEVEQGHYHGADLEGASEAFIASSTREVQAVAAIDGVALTNPPGPRTTAAAAALAAAVRAALARV